VNIVLSSNTDARTQLELPPDVLLAASLEDLCALLQDPTRAETIDQVFVIGGEAVYGAALEAGLVDRVYLTLVHDEYECDKFMPTIR
jgi:dihydrofolate reductase